VLVSADESATAMPRRIAESLGLREGAEADPARLAEAALPAQREAASADAARYLAAAERTVAGLRSYLEGRRYLPGVVEEVVARARQLGWVDDSRFAAMLVREKPGRGRARILADLRRRGVPSRIAEQAAAGVDEDSELRAVMPLVARRYFHLDRETALRRASGFLVRRGFAPGRAFEAVRRALGREGRDGSEEA